MRPISHLRSAARHRTDGLPRQLPAQLVDIVKNSPEMAGLRGRLEDLSPQDSIERQRIYYSRMHLRK